MPDSAFSASVATAESSLTASFPSLEARRIIADRERRWQAMSAAQQATWFDRRRQAWAGTHTVADVIDWFSEPVVIGVNRDNERQVFVALGIRLRTARKLDGLVIDQRGNNTPCPVLLSRLQRYAPAFEICFYPDALYQLAHFYNIELLA